FAHALFEDRGLQTYLKLAADAVGFKMLATGVERGLFIGGRLAVASAELGQLLHFSPGYTLRFAVGGSADLALGAHLSSHQNPGGFAAQSEPEAYAEISLDLARSVRLFVRGSVVANWSSQFD